MNAKLVQQTDNSPFSGHIILFHAFDIGDDINLDTVQKQQRLPVKGFFQSKHFKNYHTPLDVVVSGLESPSCISAKIHSFGVITLQYSVPFASTLEQLRQQISTIYDQYLEQSIKDAEFIAKRIKETVLQYRLFYQRNEYVLVQVAPKEGFDAVQLKAEYGSIIASTLRFETESLSEYKKNEILESGLRYYRGDLIIVDTEAAFIYDSEYEDTLDLFEFATMQQCELKYFDKALDDRLTAVYGVGMKRLHWTSYLPFVGLLSDDPVSSLSKLRVDISVIIERLGNSIKLADDAYYNELYILLAQKLDLKNWKESIDNKLAIIEEITKVFQDKANTLRENILSVSIIMLFIIEIIFNVINLLS